MNNILVPIGRYLFNTTNNAARSVILSRNFCYKSSLSLDKLYPNSSLKIVTPEFAPLEPEAKFTGYIPIEKLDITYSRSSGPGGQNVNKVNTKVDLRFKVSDADWLDQSIRDKITKLHYNKLSKEGYLIFKSDLTRSQHLNLADCMKKMRDFIRVIATPKPVESPLTLEQIRLRKLKESRDRLRFKREVSQKRRESVTSINDL